MHHAGPTAYAVGLPRNGSATSSAGPNPGRSGPNPVPSKPKAVRPGTLRAMSLEAIGLCVARFRLPVDAAWKAKHTTRYTTPVPRLTPLGFHGTGPPPRPPVQLRSSPSPRPSGLGHATPRRLKPLGFLLHGFACPLSRRGKPNTPRDAPRRSHGLRRWASTERVRHLSRRSARSAFDHTSYTRPGATNSTFRGPAAAISAAISAAYRALRCTTIQRTSRRSLRISSMKLAEQ